MLSNDISGYCRKTKQDEVPANMLPSVSAAMAKREAYGTTLEMILAFAFDVGIGSKITALTGAPEVTFDSEAATATEEVPFSTARS